MPWSVHLHLRLPQLIHSCSRINFQTIDDRWKRQIDTFDYLYDNNLSCKTITQPCVSSLIIKVGIVKLYLDIRICSELGSWPTFKKKSSTTEQDLQLLHNAAFHLGEGATWEVVKMAGTTSWTCHIFFQNYALTPNPLDSGLPSTTTCSNQRLSNLKPPFNDLNRVHRRRNLQLFSRSAQVLVHTYCMVSLL